MTHREEILADGVRLICGDCRTLVDLFPRSAACVTDPPYGIRYSHGVGGGKLARSTQFDHHPIVGDDTPFDPTPWLRFDRVVLFGANHFADKLPPSSNWLVWDKRDGICTNDQADCEMAWTNLDGPARLTRHLWNGMLKASERGEIRVHPTQKPVAVMEWVLRQTTERDQLVIDPFAGSGTTGVAAVRLGRRFTGVEIHEPYFSIACRRIEEALRQPDLFIEPFDKRSGPKPPKQEAFL